MTDDTSNPGPQFALMELDSLCGGELEQKFQHLLQQVATNINDPNTKAQAPRRIKLEIEFTPTKQRSAAGVTIKAEAVLAAHRKGETTAFFTHDVDTGTYVVQEHNPQQHRIQFDASKAVADKADASTNPKKQSN